ncbi:MAG: YncE family protein [Hyphomicrobiales bacterium]|nr:MAG: YncE family protein [Hyphomicrobiales bacterium]
MRSGMYLAATAAVALMATAGVALAEMAVSANDGKVKLNDGKVEVVKAGTPDTVSIIDLGANPPKVLAELTDIPNSVVGPPFNVALTPKQEIALVASNMKVDPADPTKTVPDDRLTVIDLTPLTPTLTGRLKTAVGLGKNDPPPVPKVIATLQVGKGAASIALNKAGTLGLVANRNEGTVSILSIAGKTVTVTGKVTVGGEKSGPSGVAITPDGKTALVTLDSDNKIVVLAIDGSAVTVTDRFMTAGLRPYPIDIVKTGEVAVVANVGATNGDADTMSVIDLKAQPPRVVNTVSVGMTPESLKVSPDGKYVAVIVNNGSNLAAKSPFFNAAAKLQVWARNGTQLTKSGEVAAGRWCQGIAWRSDNRTLLLQCMVEEEISVVRFSGGTGNSLQKVGSIKTKGGPAGIRTAEP